jgi:hypothetical protein
MEGFVLLVIVLAAILVFGFLTDLYWWLIRLFARKVVREPLDRWARRRADRADDE